ncbi:MAG: PAS domain S-box protein [Planctomycetes bacterium]|nr:PAS domain S-box protein [Planctomycetota bacterium]
MKKSICTQQPRTNNKKHTILIVDDNNDSRVLLKTLLKGHGDNPTIAENGKKALKKIADKKFDLIISDIFMPVMDGFKFCQTVKEDGNGRNIPFIFYSAAYKRKEDEEFALKIGAARFVRKPVEPKKLLSIIKEVINESEKREFALNKAIVPNNDEKEIASLYSERLAHQLIHKEEELHDSEERLLSISNTINDAIIIIDSRGIITYANKSAEKLFGYSNSEFIGQGLCDTIMPKKYANAHLEGIKQFKKTGEGNLIGKTAELCAKRKDNTVFPIELSLSSFKIRNKWHAVSVIRDITPRKLADALLKKSADTLQKSYGGMISALSHMAEARDPYTAGHQLRVAELARSIAVEMGFPSEQTDGIFLGGLIHDIGKICVPAEILSKPGKLSDIEFKIIQNHPQVGFDILKEITFPWPIAQIIQQHHERLDGSGYPNNLSNSEIIPEAKVIGVADTVEAVASHRPYRPSLGIENALEIIANGRESAFDTDIVNTCIKLFNEKQYKFA